MTFNLLMTGNTLTGTIANSGDPDKMPHHVAFHLGLFCLLRHNLSSGNEIDHVWKL